MNRLALAALLAMPSAAMAQDYDSKWIGETLRQSLHDSARPRVYRTPRQHKPPPEPRHRDRESEQHPSTKVFGFTTHGKQRVQVDVLSSVVCMPPVHAISTEANTVDGAWRDAQRVWENNVRFLYGERLMGVQHAAAISKQCTRSSGNQSLVGRAVESMASAVGQDGYKHRCLIIAQPCMPPMEQGPAIKSDGKE